MKKSSIIGFVLMLTVCGFCGGVLAVVIGLNDHSLAWLFEAVYNWLFSNILAIQIVCFALLFAGSLAIYLVCQRRRRLYAEDYDRIDAKIAPWLDIGIVINSSLYIIMFVLFSLAVQTEIRGWETLIFLIACACAFVMEITYIRLVKNIYPKRKGDPLSIKFSEQWIDSCDELERKVTYITSYKTLNALRYVILGLFVLFMLLGITFPIGVLPQLVLAAIWLFINVYTLVVSRKLSNGENLE